MEAIRQFVTVKTHQINITLPDDFNAAAKVAYHSA